jgi:hypothetical protein
LSPAAAVGVALALMPPDLHPLPLPPPPTETAKALAPWMRVAMMVGREGGIGGRRLFLSDVYDFLKFVFTPSTTLELEVRLGRGR